MYLLILDILLFSYSIKIYRVIADVTTLVLLAATC